MSHTTRTLSHVGIKWDYTVRQSDNSSLIQQLSNYFVGVLLRVVLLGLVAGLCSAPSFAVAQTSGPANGLAVEVLPIRDNMFMFVTKGSNITVQLGRDGVLVVDSSYPELAEDVFAEIRKLSDGKLRFMINTSASPDHTGGNWALGKRGGSVADRTYDAFSSTITGAIIYAHENVLNTMSSRGDSADTWPTDTYFVDQADLYFNDDSIKMYYVPAAHSDGDTVVHFRRADVVSTGEIFLTTSYPHIDIDHGGTINGIIAGLNLVLRVTVPAALQEDGTLVVPGHGRLCDEADVVEYRDMLTVIRDRVRNMKEQGMSFEEVWSGRPGLDYDARYGAADGPSSPREFIRRVYETLQVEPDSL